MKPIPFAIRHLLPTMAVALSLILANVLASSCLRIESADLTGQENCNECARSQDVQQPASPTLSQPETKMARRITQSTIPARIIRRRDPGASARLAFHTLPQTGIVPFSTVFPGLLVLPDHRTFVCHGMAGSSWGLPGVVLSRIDRATI